MKQHIRGQIMMKALRRGFGHGWLAAAAVALALAGCGGGGGGGGGTPPPASGTFTLSVSTSGSGAVTSSTGGINCGTACSAVLPAGTSVTLTAAPAPGQRLQAWGGACSGSAATCTVTMDVARSVSATFAAIAPTTFALDVTVTGSGAVTSAPAGIDCGSTCSANYTASTAVTLTATPASGQTLQGWGGACSGQAATCNVTMDAARSVSATFVAAAPTTFALDVTVTGNGAVSSVPAGINCGSSCSASYAANTSVVLTATPAQGQLLSAWGGSCAGQAATCTVAMSAARTVTATFTAAPAPALAWGTAALLENSNDFNVAGTNTFADAEVLSAIDANGNAIVIWQQSDGTPDGNTQKVFSRRYTAAQGWTPAVAIPGLVTSSSSVNLVTGRVLMDSAGNATWIRHNFEARRYGAAGGWPATAFVPATIVGELVDAKIDASDNIHALAYGGGEVRYNRVASGSNQWTTWADVSASGQQASRYAQMALGSQGSVIAVWRERNPGDTNYSMKANRTVGGAWQTPVRIEEVLTNVIDSMPRIASDANGNAVAAWHQGSVLYASRFDAATGAWAAPTEVVTGLSGATFSARIQLAMAADGRAVLGWNSTFELRAATYTPGVGFSAPAAVNSYNAGYFIGIDQNGRASVVYRSVSQWPNPTDATQNVYARDLPWGGTWSAAALIETGAGDVKGNVPCAMNATGQAVCTWAQDDLANDAIRNSLWANVRR
jgi:hypothetical protein